MPALRPSLRASTPAAYNLGMGGAGTPEWLIREDAGQPVLIALYLRQVLGISAPDELPHLRGIPPRVNDRAPAAQSALEAQWRTYWDMTVEPLTNPSPVPLDLVDGFDTLLALPIEGADQLRAAVMPHGARSRRVRAVGERPLPARRRLGHAARPTARTPARSPSTSARSAVARTRSS